MINFMINQKCVLSKQSRWIQYNEIDINKGYWKLSNDNISVSSNN